MKLHLPKALRVALLAVFACNSYTLAAESAQTIESSWSGGSHVELEDTSSGEDVLIRTNTAAVQDAVSIILQTGANYTIDILDSAGSEGYGVLGNGETVINVEGSGKEISDTSLNIHGFLDLSELNIRGNSVVTLSPGMFMNGDMTHDIAGKEGLEKSLGVRIGAINLDNGTLVLNNGSGYLFDNGGYDSYGDSVTGGEGYTLNVTHDAAYVQVGANMRTRWALLNGEKDGTYHSLRIGGLAREFDVTEISGLKDLVLEGGYLTFRQVENAIHGNLNIEHAASVVVGGNNMMAEGSGNLIVAGSLDIGTTAQRLTGSNTIVMNNGLIKGVNTQDNLTDGLQLLGSTQADNTVELTYEGMVNRISADVHIDGLVRFVTQSAHLQGEVQDMLTLSGYVSGNGDISISGSGVVEFSSANEHFTGSVFVSQGSSLILGDVHSLSSADKLTISEGSHLYLNTDGNFPVVLRELHLGNGATLAISSLNSSLSTNADLAAVKADSISFDSNGVFNILFNEKLRTMGVYNIFVSGNAVAASGLSDINFFMRDENGALVSFLSDQYVMGSQAMDGGGYLYYVETRFGNNWTGGEENDWSSSSKVWNNGQSYDSSRYDYALFFNQDGVASSSVNLSEVVSVKGIYVQNVGGTRYVFKGGVDGVDIAGGTEFHMRDTAEASGAGNMGNGSYVELQNVQAGSAEKAMGWMSVSTGELRLTQGSQVYFDGNAMLQVGAVGDALLSVESGSQLISATGATLTAHGNSVAGISGVKITNNAILGGNSTSSTEISSLENAALNGFHIEAIDLKGTGSITNGGIGAVTGLDTDYDGITSVAADATWTLGGKLDFKATLFNKGTIIIADGTLFNFSDLKASSVNGNSYTYTFIDGGSVKNWNNLSHSNFQFGDVNLGEVKNYVSMSLSDGSVTLTYSDIRPITWDSGWGLTKTPMFGKTFTGGTSTNANMFSSEDPYPYAYVHIVSTATGADTVVVVKGGGSTTSPRYLAGGISWGWCNATDSYWLLDEGSDYQYKIGGMMSATSSSNIDTSLGAHLTGDTHLMITGAGNRDDYEVYGGSFGVYQTGDAYLSINAGGYQNIYGGSRDVDLNGNVHIRLNGGKLNTYFEGVTYTAPQGMNGEFIFDSAWEAEDAMGRIYDAPANSVAHWGGIYATGSNWGTASGAATKVLGDADIYLGSAFDFSSNLAIIDGGAAHVQGTSTLHFMDGAEYSNLNKGTLYAWIHAADERYAFFDQYSSDDQQGEQPLVGKFTSVEIRGFDRIELADGAKVTLQSSRFNTDTDVTISGSGVIELLRPEIFQLNYYGIQQAPFCEKDSEQGRTVEIPRRNITLENGARLKVSTDFITAWNADSGFTALTATRVLRTDWL